MNGIIILVNKNHFELDKTPHIDQNVIICHLKSKHLNLPITVVCAYFKPKSSPQELSRLTDSINELDDSWKRNLIIGGDFNARTGDMCAYDEENWENLSPHPCLTFKRNSNDKSSNTQGKALIDLSAELGVVMLNGRFGPGSGSYTYVQNGRSVVDYILTSIHLTHYLTSFKIENIGESDHLPISCRLKLKPTALPKSKLRRSIRISPPDYVTFANELETIHLNIEEDCNGLSKSILENISKTAEKLGLTSDRIKHSSPKPWFDKTCRYLRKQWRKLRRKISLYQKVHDSVIRQAEAAKAEYKNTCKEKRKTYYNQIADAANLLSGPRPFWDATKRCSPRILPQCPVTSDQWSDFYRHVYPPRNIPDTCQYTQENQALDEPIRLDEVENMLRKLKPNKSPGIDGIPNSVLKILPENWTEALTTLFNKIMVAEHVPENWADIELIPLYKKGETGDPGNYRGIALIKTITKLFTGVIEHRMYKWAEEQKLLPESQAGFRKHRSCSDQIFSLDGLIKLHIRHPRRRVFVTFVDFKRAFDSVNHDFLWAKLNHLGVSGKIIRVLNSIYSKANFQVRTSDGHTPPIQVTEGVLQGEILSPLLFTLFISDMENYFRAQGHVGLSIDSKSNLLMLLFADDTAIIGYSEGDVQKKLCTLHQYCSANGLTVNVDKTKVMIAAQRACWSKTDFRFVYDGNEVEKVKEYTYLGVPFYRGGKFNGATRYFKNKGLTALHSINQIAHRGRIKRWVARNKLFDACVLPAMLYGSEVWGFDSHEALETVQMKFLKQNLGITKTTANHATRAETGRISIQTHIHKKMLSLWYKILNMDQERTQRKIYDKMLALKDENLEGPTFWTTQIKTILSDIGMQVLWDRQSPELVSQNWSKITVELNTKSLMHDHRRIQISTSSRLIHWKKNVRAEPYLFSAALKVRQTWSQLRLASPIFPSIVGLGNLRHKLDPKQDCEVCNLHSPDTIDHFLFVCPQYEGNRKRFLDHHLRNTLLADTASPITVTSLAAISHTTIPPTTISPTTISPTTVSPTTISPTTIDPTPLFGILNSTDETVMMDMYRYVVSSLRVRSFLLDL